MFSVERIHKPNTIHQDALRLTKTTKIKRSYKKPTPTTLNTPRDDAAMPQHNQLRDPSLTLTHVHVSSRERVEIVAKCFNPKMQNVKRETRNENKQSLRQTGRLPGIRLTADGWREGRMHISQMNQFEQGNKTSDKKVCRGVTQCSSFGSATKANFKVRRNAFILFAKGFYLIWFPHVAQHTHTHTRTFKTVCFLPFR